jgi:gluconate:H+ symporter, GntP family
LLVARLLLMSPVGSADGPWPESRTRARGARFRSGGRLVELLALLTGLPLPVWMILASLAMAIGAGMRADAVIATFNQGFGTALGEFVLILVPSFVVAEALSKTHGETGSGDLVALMAPFAGAGMVCPDTAYAALSPVAGSRKLAVAFGAYAGFKLLVPAGPAIVATALGGFDGGLAMAAVPVFIAAWVTGLVYARRHEPARGSDAGAWIPARVSMAVAVPFSTLAALLVSGLVLRGRVALPPMLDFLLTPKGALLGAATAALVLLPASDRLDAVERALRRTMPLLLTIGAASAFGFILVRVLPFVLWGRALIGTGLALPALFTFATLFKMAKGSSMATFAGTGAITAALLPSLGVSPVAATLALCAGAFVTITPNDSFYWLIRQDAFPTGDATATRVLAIGATLQGTAALTMILVMHWAHLI